MKRLFKIFPLMLVIGLVACGDGLTKKVVSTFDSGETAIVRYYDKDNHCVREVQYFEGGAIFMEGGMDGEKREGEWVSYFSNGKVQSKGYFKDDERDGEALIYHENGNLFIKGEYCNGVKCGEWIYYDEQGYETDRIVYPKQS